MSDLIDRQAALKKIGQINGILLFNGAILINYLDAEKAIEDLPSFPQRHENDCISRQAVIDAIMAQPPESHYPSWYAEQIKNLPSAQPEIVRCKDCKHYQFADNRAFRMPVKMCMWFGFEDVDDYDFCSKAERKEGEAE